MWVTKWKVTVEDDSTRWTEQSLATVKLACINPGLPTWTFILKASLLFKALRHWIICPLKQFVVQRHHTSLPNCLFCGHGACARDTLIWKQSSHLLLLVCFQSSKLSWKVTISVMSSLTPWKRSNTPAIFSLCFPLNNSPHLQIAGLICISFSTKSSFFFNVDHFLKSSLNLLAYTSILHACSITKSSLTLCNPKQEYWSGRP